MSQTWTTTSPYSTKPLGHVHGDRCWERYFTCAMARIAYLEEELEKARDSHGEDA